MPHGHADTPFTGSTQERFGIEQQILDAQDEQARRLRSIHSTTRCVDGSDRAKSPYLKQERHNHCSTNYQQHGDGYHPHNPVRWIGV